MGVTPHLITADKNPLTAKDTTTKWVETTEGYDDDFLLQYVAIKSTIPKSPDFSAVNVTGGRSGPVLELTLTATPAPHVIPDSGGRDAALWYAPWTNQVDSTALVPGEQISQECQYQINAPTAASAYYYALALTGGTIVAKRDHPDVTGAFLYDVSIEGDTYTDLHATDLRQYFVDDWVQLVKVSTETADLSHTAAHLAKPAGAPTFSGIFALRIAPITVT